MKLLKLEYFVETCNHGSITKASNVLYVSQPAISSAIRDLEKEYGVKLFFRKNNQLTLTPEGKYLLKKAPQLLHDAKKLELDMKDLGGSINKLSIGVPPMIGMLLFPDIFRKYKEKYPKTTIQMLEAGSLEIRNYVQNNMVNFAIGIIDDHMSGNFNYNIFYKTELVFCVSKLHHLAKQKEIAFSQLNNEKIILLKEDSFQNPQINDRISQEDSTPNILLETSQIPTIIKFLEFGDTGAFLFKGIAEMYDGIVSIPLETPIKINIGVIWKKNETLYSNTQRLINFIKENYKQNL